MRLIITIELGNDAMHSAPDVIESLTHSRLAAPDPEPLNQGETGNLYDRNGNKVGTWMVVCDE